MFKIIDFCVIILIALPILHAKKVQTIELTKGWTLRDSGSLQPMNVVKVPSGVYTELSKSFGDLLAPGNDVNLRWIANKTWIYSTSFEMGDELGQDSLVNLTFHGIDTVAKIRLNGNLLGETDNMFVRYSYVVGHLLQYGTKLNQLEVEILSPLQEASARAAQLDDRGAGAPPSCPQSRGSVECHRNMLRKMQMSFGGEWNPAALSSGLWKPVTIEYYAVAILRDVDVAINRNDTHWTMDCRAFISTSDYESFYGQLVVYASELFAEPFVIQHQKLSYAHPKLEFQIHIPKEKVKLWWPNGYGKQVLYPVSFNLKTYRSEEGPSLSSRTDSQMLLNIGFRTIELVEDEDARGRTFYFRVNGHPIFMKGVNYVPAHTLPELSADSDTLQNLLKSARDANMNMIRVWGGGLYESDTFYSLADSYGLLIWQDMAFTKATYPVTDEMMASMRLETAQNAQRLAYHASLAMIVTNDEIELFLVKNRSDFGTEAKRLEEEYKLLFLGNLSPELNIISRNDFKPRPGPMISTPSMGIAESGKELAKDPQSPNYGDVHFFEDDASTQGVYPDARFVSEFGYASLPMRSSWLRDLGQNASEESLAALIRQRQHDPKGFIPLLRQIAYELPFNLQNWEDNIDEFIYFSQVAQAMSIKKSVELFRSRRGNYSTMGALIWQLNDVWVAPTWSCIDFYGNYKLVYFWAKEFFAPTSILAVYHEASNQINISISRELVDAHTTTFNLFINTFLWDDIFPKSSIARAISVGIDMGSNTLDQLHIPIDSVLYEAKSKTEIFLEILLKDDDDKIVAQNYFYPVPIKNIVGIQDPGLKIELHRGDCANSKPYNNNFSLRITIQYPTLFIYLELVHETYAEVRHTFSMNGFTQTVPRQIVTLEIEDTSECIKLTTDNIRVKTMNQYMV
ncbi:hypothetical protein KR044_009796 [Drosophila immigrans]|nr:hypothetical protein KR044_009796 [Drosophila immigrans]